MPNGARETHRTRYPRGPGRPALSRGLVGREPRRHAVVARSSVVKRNRYVSRRTAHRGLSCVAVLRALRAPRFRRERLRHHKRHQSECLTSPRNPGHARDTRRAARPGSRREPTGETERQRETVRDGSNPATSTQQRMDLLLPWRENPAAQRGRRGWRRSGLPRSREHSAASLTRPLSLSCSQPLSHTQPGAAGPDAPGEGTATPNRTARAT